MQQPTLKGLTVKIVEGFRGGIWIRILNKDKSFARSSSINRQMYLYSIECQR